MDVQLSGMEHNEVNVLCAWPMIFLNHDPILFNNAPEHLLCVSMHHNWVEFHGVGFEQMPALSQIMSMRNGI